MPGGRYYGVKKAAKKVYKYAQANVPKGTMANFGSKAGSGMAAAMGGPSDLGASIGRAVGQQVANLTGVGAYGASYRKPKSRSRSIMNPATSYAPKIQASGNNEDLIISNTEYITDLYSGTGTPTAFNLDEFSLNPGLDVESGGGLFAWLPNIANAYSQYTFLQCVISYRSKSGNATGADTSLGSVFMSANYTSTDDAPKSKGDMLNSQYATSAPSDKNMNFPIECNPKTKNLKMHQVRTGTLKADQNQDMFDAATVYIATQGLQTAGQLLGELWVSYTVKFSKKRRNDRSELIRTANYRWTGAAGQGPTSAYPLGQSVAYPTSQPSPSAGSSLPLTINASNLAGPQYIQFPEYLTSGIYFVGLRYRSAIVSAITWSQPGWSLSNCTFEACLFSPQSAGGQYSPWNNQQTTTPTTLYFSNAYIVRITGQNARISLDGSGTLDTDIVDFQILVTELNPDAFGNGI